MSAFVPKLYYFDLAGKGEAVRLAAAFSGYPIQDIRLSRDEFLAMKEVYKIVCFIIIFGISTIKLVWKADIWTTSSF
jgi:hypothetical protein